MFSPFQAICNSFHFYDFPKIPKSGSPSRGRGLLGGFFGGGMGGGLWCVIKKKFKERGSYVGDINMMFIIFKFYQNQWSGC